jgi:N-acetylglutamate synthase-like GNAT family acetyltransferase
MLNKALLSVISVRPLTHQDVIPYKLLLDADPSKELVDGYLKVADTYIAQINNQTIGVYVLYPVNPTTGEIKNIAIAEGLQGIGIGKYLLQDAFDKARQKGYKELLIATSSVSVEPLHLYQKMGFEVSHILKNFVLDNYPEPVIDGGLQCKHMIVLSKQL